MDPVLRGSYPEDGLQLFGQDMPSFPSGDLEEMRQPIDFLGTNIYKADTYRTGADGAPEAVPVPPGHPRSGVDWQPITPDALYYGPRFTFERYGLPTWITEHGLSTRDQVFLDGKVHDPQRIDYTQRYLRELAKAVADGTAVRGYFHWSIMDNFEWAEGYKQRFGMVYVDYNTQKRTPKDSALWYKQVIAANGRNL
jgi:beta-glucosidase